MGALSGNSARNFWGNRSMYLYAWDGRVRFKWSNSFCSCCRLNLDTYWIRFCTSCRWDIRNSGCNYCHYSGISTRRNECGSSNEIHVMELDKMLIYAGVGVAGFLAKWLFDKLIKSDDHYHSLQLQIVKLE